MFYFSQIPVCLTFAAASVDDNDPVAAAPTAAIVARLRLASACLH